MRKFGSSEVQKLSFFVPEFCLLRLLIFCSFALRHLRRAAAAVVFPAPLWLPPMPIINGLLLAMPLSLLIDWPLLVASRFRLCIRNLFYGTGLPCLSFWNIFHKGKKRSAGCFSYPALRVLAFVFPFALATLGFFFSSFNPARARHSSSVISCGFLPDGMRKNFFPD